MEAKGEDKEAIKLKNFIYWNSFSVQKWYNPLKEFTFESSFIYLSIEEAEQFVQFQNQLLEKLDNKEFPSYEQFPALTHLEEKLSKSMEPFLTKKGACFVKMSDRSPKDSVTERGRIQKFLEKPLKEMENKDLASNEFGLPAVYRAFNQALRVTSARDAMELLLTSFRTLEDVNMRLEYKSTLWELVIVIREWVDFDPALEFRGFVNNKNLNGLSQYYYDCYFPFLEKNSEKIVNAIKSFHEKVKDKVPYDSYICDFAILPCDLEKEENLPVVVIELNPFDEFTDGKEINENSVKQTKGGLFHWNLHKNTIMNGPFTLKLVTSSKKEARTSWWRRIIINFLNKS